jgi:steroid 5-alpha reductase family enzyme
LLVEVLVVAGVVIVVLMVATWLISLAIKDASIVDMVWGFGFVVAVWAAFAAAGAATSRGVLTVALVSVWGIRLTGYLVWRNLGKGEDYRYQAMRAKNPDNFWIVSLFKVFLLQGALMFVVAVPVVATQVSDTPLFWLDYAGIAVWATGLFFETVGDIQLARFKAQPDSSGRVMDRGLWRYTRHPNYFGDFCVWWGHYAVALAGSAWWSVFSPLVMSVLLIRVSGAGLLEKTIGDRRPGYAEYIATTNAFFPGGRRQETRLR